MTHMILCAGFLEEFELMRLIKFGEATYVYTGESDGASGFNLGPNLKRSSLFWIGFHAQQIGSLI